MLVLGVTGDVGAGKSTVTKIFAEYGATTINADHIAHEMWKKGEVLGKAAGRWGEDIIFPDGRINSSRVASIVFSDRNEYDWLCNVLHPLIRSEMERRVLSLGGFVVAEIPLLFENGVPWWIDITMYISSPFIERKKRNLPRGWGEDEILKRESFLLDRSEKISMADIVIRNEGTLESLKENILSLSSKMKNFASLSEITIILPSQREAMILSSCLLERKLALNIELYSVSTLSVSDQKQSENNNWKLVLLAFQKNFNQILKTTKVSGVTSVVAPFLKDVKRPGSIWKKYIPEEIRV